MEAYGQSAGYAEQAINAIRVVQAFGQEEKEIRNFNKYLVKAKNSGIRNTVKSSLILAGMFFVIFGTYSYSFFMGSVWIKKQFHNDTYNRPYQSGEILSCFFGVVFGLMAVGNSAPNIKAVIEGRTAGKMAFDIIERSPTID